MKMGKLIRCASLLLLVCSVASCDFTRGVEGSGNLKTESRPVSGFTGVEVHGSAKLVVEQGDAESLSVTADDNLLQHLASDVTGSKLTLGPRDVSVSPSEQIVYKLSVKNLNSIGVSGDVTVDATGIKTESLSIGISGAGNISISGEAAQQTISISGIGKYKGENFQTADTSVAISGSGQAVVAASKRLDVQVSGSADVRYVGNPEVTKSVSGFGTVETFTP